MDNGYERSEGQVSSVDRTIAYALAVLGLDAVQRSTIRALLPAGETKSRGLERRQRQRLGEAVITHKNRTSLKFGQALQRFERNGWVRRSPDLVYVTDRAALLEHALQGQPAPPRGLLDVRAALGSVQAEQRATQPPLTGARLAQRRHELRALTRLMQAPAGGGSSVRIVHKPSLI